MMELNPGEQYGEWTVLRKNEGEMKGPRGGTQHNPYICQCSCGTIASVEASRLRTGGSKCCGHCEENLCVGRRYGKVVILSTHYDDKRDRLFCECKCDCGNVYTTTLATLKSTLKLTGSVACGNCIVQEMIGKKFGRLTVIKELPLDKWGQRIYLCKCDCGNEHVASSANLRNGNVTSCGCLTRSRGAQAVYDYLIEHNYTFEEEYRFSDCKGKSKELPFDFYLPKENVLIEVDGDFHRLGESHLTTEQMEKYDMFERERLDHIKTQYAKEHGIYLIRLPYYSAQKQKGIEKMIHELEVKLHGDQEKSR